MKTRAKKQEDLKVLTEQLKDSTSAMVLSFTKLTVDKDQAFRNEVRETGATYRVVKNTLARLAAKGTPFEEASAHFKGVTSIATTNGEPVDLSKVIAKHVKESKGIFEFKAGVVGGRIVDFSEVEKIATLPSKDELIGKLLFLLNAPAQRLATVLNAVPRDLAIVLKQTSERTDNLPGGDAATEAPPAEEAKTEVKEESSNEDEAKADESADTTVEAKTEATPESEVESEETNEEKADEQKEDDKPAVEEKADDSEEKDS